MSYHCTENSYIITIAVQIQLQYLQAPKRRLSSILAEAARICYNPAVGSVWGGGGGEVSLQLILITWPQAVRQMRGGGGGKLEGGEGWHEVDNSS